MNTQTQIKRNYEKGQCGAESIFYGLKDIEDGNVESVEYVVAQHHTVGDEVYRRVRVYKKIVRGTLCWRVIDSNTGDYAICASWNDQDIGLACAILASLLKREDAWIYRQ